MVKSISKERFEKEIEKRVIRRLPDVAVIKIYRRNWPDRLFLLAGGRCFFVEFKKFGKSLRRGQELVKIGLEKLGFSVYVVDTIAKGELILALWSLGNE